jgi:hypothetical protein
VITALVVVHAADAFVEPRDQPCDLGVDIDVGPLGEQIEAGGEMRLVRPFLPRKRAGEQALAERDDLGVGGEEANGKLGHRSGS